MADISAELDLEISKFRNALKSAERDAHRFAGRAKSQGGGFGQSLTGGIATAFRGIGPLLAAGLAAVGVATIGHKIGSEIAGSIREAAGREQMEISYTVLTGSKEKAQKLLGELQDLGAKTPLQFGDLGEAGKKLLAFGEAAESVPAALRRIGDVSSAIGAPIGEIAEIYGKARVQGTLFAEDINQLTGRGIPVLQEFAKQLGVPVENVKKMGSEGKLTFKNLEQAFVSLTGDGGMFAGMMEKQSGSLAGLWSTLQDNISMARLELGKPIADALKPILGKGIEMAAGLKAGLQQVGKSIGGLISGIVAAFQVLSSGDIRELLLAGLSVAFKSAVNILWRGLVASVRAAGTLLGESVVAIVGLLAVVAKPEFWAGVGAALLSFGNAIRALLLKAMAELVEGAKKIPGLSQLIETDPAELQAAAERAWEASKAQGREAKDQFSPAFSDFRQTMAGIGQEIAGSFADGFRNTKGVFDTSKEIQQLSGAGVKIQAQVAANQAKAAEMQTEAAKAPEGGGTAGGSGSPALAQGLGGLASAVQMLTGGGQQKLVLDQAKKQTATMEKVSDTLSRIEKKKPAKPEVTIVQTRPVFAGI